MVLDEVLRVDVEGLQEPRVALEKVLLVVSADNNCYKSFKGFLPYALFCFTPTHPSAL